MGSPSPAGRRRILPVLALCAAVIGTVATLALAAGPGGWDHLGDRGMAGSDALNLVASALTVTPDALYVGGEFTDAGGIPEADRIATWNGSAWSAVSSPASQIANGRVSDIAVSGGKVYAGGTFTNAGGNANADYLAVWDGASWQSFCSPQTGTGPSFSGNVTSLQIVGQTLYVGGTFLDAAQIPSADGLLACDLTTGASTSTVLDQFHPFGQVLALAADSAGTLYAGGGFANLEDIPAADNVAFRPLGGTWQPMGAGAGPCSCAVTTFVRGLTTVGTDAYVGTDANDIAGIPQADHVAKWNGSEWSALGADGSGANGWFPTAASIEDLAGEGPNLFVAGTFLNAGGDARADHVAFFDGTSWHPLGSDGAVNPNGPWNGGTGLALAIVDRQLYAAGSFTSAGGDTQAQAAASFSLAQVIAYPTPTVTAGPTGQPTPTVTPGPSAVPTPTVTPAPPAPDVVPPATRLRSARIQHAQRRATFKFASGETGTSFVCKLDGKRAAACTSPKTYRKLQPGKHVFRVRARDAAGNLDASPTVKRFRIKKR
jgi:hypothetical protein